MASLDRAGARVVWIDLCNGDRSFATSTLPQGEDLSTMLASLARGYLDRHPCARMADAERRYDTLVETFEAVGARGVIYASLKFCDSYLYDFPRVQERLNREGIPVLRLESDYTRRPRGTTADPRGGLSGDARIAGLRLKPAKEDRWTWSR